MKREENERLTLTGPGTPAGEWMRRYWQPVALSEELLGGRPLIAPRVLSEDLVLFRNEKGVLGLVERRCAHRGADLFFGRLEGGGLRCYFHGWLYGTDGACLETPAEPEGSRLSERVCLKSYPVVECNGIIWGYLGPGTPPDLPSLDCFTAPEAYTFAFKGYYDCNWLQALEVGIDPAHASYLHRFAADEDVSTSYGKQFRSTPVGSDLPMTKILREFSRPEIQVDHTPYGLRIAALRKLGGNSPETIDERTHVRVTHQIFPNGFLIPLSPTMTITQWHVPVDDTSCYWYAMFTGMDGPVDKAEMRRQRVAEVTLPDYRPIHGRADMYGFDPDRQHSSTYTGLGPEVNVQDQMAVEGQGTIYDRTREHLGRTDKAITAYRRMLLESITAVERGEKPLFINDSKGNDRTDPMPVDGIAPSSDWQTYHEQVTKQLRAARSWSPQSTSYAQFLEVAQAPEAYVAPNADEAQD